MKQIVLLILLLWGGFSAMGQTRKVIQAEYFWNTDPGLGLGSPLQALDGNLDQSIEELFATSTAVLNVGPNKFGIRVKDAQGVWSNTFYTVLQVDSVSQTVPTLLANRQVTQAEYFWNTDPGNGNAIPLLALDGNLDQSIEELFATSTTVLNYGPNKFGIRVKDADGVWSRTFLTLVQVDSVDNTVPSLFASRKVTQAEYFWNTDPGNGNATPLLALDGNLDQSIEELFTTSTTVLNYGPNKFGIRVKDGDGVWSRTFLTLVQVDSVDNTVPSLLATRKVTQAEYFWNTDPGNGNAIPLLALDGNLDQSIEELFATSTTVLNYGPNKFGIRVKDADGVWSRTFLTLVQVDSVDNTVPSLFATRKVTQAEYFWNTDPGNGNATPLLALDGNLDQSIEELFATSTTVLNYGPNKFGIRVKDGDGVWSRTFLTLVQVDSVDNTVPSLLANRKVTKGEYFWDSDPGVGSGIPLFFVDGQGDQSVEELQAIDPVNLSNGVHRIGLRVFDSDHQPSRTFLTIMVVEGDSSNDFNVYTNTHLVRQCRGGVARLQAFGAKTYQWFPSVGLSSDTGAVVFASPDSSTHYLVVGMDSMGRRDSAMVWVKVINEVQILALGNPQFCQGQSVQLKAKADSAASFQWLKNLLPLSGAIDSVLPVVVAGSYQVIANVDGCVDTSLAIAVMVDTPQNFQLSLGSTSICQQSGTWAFVQGNSLNRQVEWSRNGVVLPQQSDSLWISDAANYTVAIATPCGVWRDSFQLNVIPTDTVNISQKICAGQTYLFKGMNLNQSGVYRDTLSNALGCDSIVVLNLLVDTVPLAFVADTLSFCGNTAQLQSAVAGTGFLWNTGATGSSITVQQSGWYALTVQRDLCSSTDSVYVDLLEVDLGNDTAICSGGSISLKVRSLGGGTSNGLPSNLRQGLVGYWPFNGNAQDESGNGNHGTVNGPILTTDRFGNASSAFLFNGDEIQINNNAIFNLKNGFSVSFWFLANTNYFAQDLIMKGTDRDLNAWWLRYHTYAIDPNLNFAFKPFSNGADQVGFLSPNQNTWTHVVAVVDSNSMKIFENGRLKNTISNIQIPANNINNSNLTFGTVQYPFSGKIDDVSIFNRTLTSSEIQQFFGQNQNSYSWSTGDTTPSITVTPSQTTTYYCTVSNGITTCTDSVVVTVNAPSTSNLSASICSGSSFAFGSRNLTAAGVYRDTLSNALGCDSIVVLTLNVNAPSTSNLSASICSGSSYAFGSRNLNAAGIYRDTLSNALGCDSIIVLTLNVNSVIVDSLNARICEGNVYAFGNRNLTVSGLYIDSLRTSSGCDSITVLQLTVNPKPNISIQASGALKFCQGGSVTLSASGANQYSWSNSSTNSNVQVNASGLYSVVGTDSNGCSGSSDSVEVTVFAPVIPTIYAMGSTTNKYVCNTNVPIQCTPASSYLWSNGATTSSITVSVSGFYSVITTDSNGCTATSNRVDVRNFTSVPPRPVAISGNLNPCGVMGTTNTLSYSVPSDPNTLAYTWLLTNGITAVGRSDSNVISVTYPAGFSTGQIRATPMNACGSGLARAIYPKTSAITTVPTFIQSVTSVCDIKGTSNTATYAIQPIPGCSSYQWTLPANSTLVSGQGTSSIQLVFAASFSSGSISVVGISACGNTPSSSITASLLAKPIIIGSNSICPGDLVTYTMPVVPGAIRYRFNLPSGLSMVSQNANSAVITNTGSFVSGSIGAQVQTTLCGWSQPGSLSLNTSACRALVGEFSVNIYPNPSRGEFQMQMGAPVKQVQVSVYAADGRLVKRQLFGQVETQTLVYNDVAEGLYHLEIIATDAENKVHRKMEKIMIQR